MTDNLINGTPDNKLLDSTAVNLGADSNFWSRHPELPYQLTTKSYVDTKSANVDPSYIVKAASTANLDVTSGLEHGDSLDGQILHTGDLILIKDQTNHLENGIYTVNAQGAATRVDPSVIAFGTKVLVDFGVVNKGTLWKSYGVYTGTNSVPVYGTDAINFNLLSAPSIGQASWIPKSLARMNYEHVPVMVVGDSQSKANSDGSVGAATFRYSNGYMTAVQYYSKERFYWRNEFNFGVSGDKTSDIVARLAAIKTAVRTYGIKAAVFHAGTNDVDAGVSSNTTDANYSTILDYLVDECGLIVFCLGSVPRNTFLGNQTKINANKTNDVNLQAQCASRVGRCFYIPLYDAVGGGTDTPLANYIQPDGIHFTAPLAFGIIGPKLADAMTAVYGQGIWDYGEKNRLTNESLNNRTAGSIGTTVTVVNGNVPSGWYLFAPTGVAGATVTFTKRPNGVMRISVSLQGTNQILSMNMFKAVDAGSYAISDILQASVYINVISATNVLNVGCNMVDQGSTTLTHSGMNGSQSFRPIPVIGEGVISTQPVELLAGNTAVNCQILATLDNTASDASIVFDVYSVKVAKITPVLN